MMTTSIDLDSWLSVLRKEYLQDFIKSGGASVKFIVPLDRLDNNTVLTELKKAAEEEGYLYTSIDAATTKLHMIDKVFHAIARQVGWDDLAYAFLCNVLSEKQYQLPKEQKSFNLANLASLNGFNVGEMRRIIIGLLTSGLFRDFTMTQEFRIAMLRLCQSQLEPQEPGAHDADIVKEWLHGELRLITALKAAHIYRKISRHNGRHILYSLARWLHVTGKTGLIIALDISRFMESKKPLDGSIYYSKPAILQGYEVLRQFIDGTDELQFCLILVLAPPSFLSPEDRYRGLWAYDALKLRIWDEVRDKQRTNPLDCLIRISDKTQTKEFEEPGGIQ